jgi:glutaredoxin
MKECIKCGQSKQLVDFYKHKRMADGHLNKCKFCTKLEAWDRRHNSEKREEILAYDRARGNRQGYSYVKEYRAKNPEIYAAHRAVRSAKERGDLIPEPCKECGSDNAHAHHHDYTKPLDVEWLCPACHRLEHGSKEMNDILNDQQLKEIFGCDQGKKLIELMQRQGVRYLVTREGKPFTTMAAVNDVLVGSGNEKQEQVTFGMR